MTKARQMRASREATASGTNVMGVSKKFAIIPEKQTSCWSAQQRSYYACQTFFTNGYSLACNGETLQSIIQFLLAKNNLESLARNDSTMYSVPVTFGFG